jgi:Domain of unknown function (DUF4112)
MATPLPNATPQPYEPSPREFPRGEPVQGELLTDDGPAGRQLWAAKTYLARAISNWSDTVFEITGLGWRFGLDPIIGLIPIAGDFATSLVSLYILSLAAEARVPRGTMLRMGLNVAIDYFVGSIPIVGNVFDFAWKANYRNMQLLERALAAPPSERTRQSRADWLILGGILAALVALLIASIVMAILIAGWISKWLMGNI